MDNSAETGGKPPKVGDSRRGNAGKGRAKGSKNRLTAQAKEAFEQAFDSIGGVKRLAEWAEKNPGDFYRIYGKLIPQPREHSGTDGQPLAIRVIWTDEGKRTTGS